MKKLFRLLIRVGIFALVIILGIMIVKTLAFSSKQIPVEPVGRVAAPEGAEERLAGAVRYATVSNGNQVDTAAFQGLDTFIRRSFPLVDSLLDLRMINTFSRLYKWPGQNSKLPPILLMGHLDVVPVEPSSSAQWEADPFAGARRDGFIWGRGTLDDKFTCLALLETAEQLLKEGYAPGRTVYFAFGHDEEIGGRNGAKGVVEYLEGQKVQFDYILDEGLVIIDQLVPGLEAPAALIGVSEKGYVTLRLTARLEEGGHSSMPPPETAIGVLSKAIVALQENPFPAKLDGATRALFRYAGPEMTLPFKMIFANLWLTGGLVKNIMTSGPTTSAGLRTTTAPTIIEGGVKDNVLPTEATAMVNFRILPGETVESVRQYVERTVGDSRVRVEVADPETAQNPSPVSPTDAFGFQVIQRTVQEVFPGVVVAPSMVVGATDSRHYTRLSDNIYRFMPVVLKKEESSRFHGVNERVSEEGYRQAIGFYRRLIENSCR